MSSSETLAAQAFKSILDAVGTMIIATDPTGVVQLFNSAAERLLGWSATEVIGRHTPALWHVAEEVATRAADLSQELGRPVSPSFEVFVAKARDQFNEQRPWTYIHKDGRRFPVQLVVSAIRDGAGTITGYLGTAQDLTARVQAEQERDRFFNLSLDMLGIANTDGYFKRINPAFSRVLGWTDDEILSRPFLDFVHPDDQAATLREVEKLATGQPTLYFENRYRCKSGSWRWLAWTCTPEPDGTLYAAGRDVTNLKQAEESLRQSHQNLAITLNSIGDAVMAADAARRITRMNPVAEQLTGWTQSEAVGRPIDEVFQIINEQTRQPAVIPVDDVLATGIVHGLANHTVLIARDGSERPIANSAAPIRNDAGEITGVVMVFRDISNERRIERERQKFTAELTSANAELAGASRAKSEFLATMSHELRTPLNGILGMNELLLTTELSARQRQYVAASSSSGELLVQLINDILDLSKIEAGKLDLDPRECDVETLVYDVVGIMAFTATQKGIALNCQIAQDACLIGLCDDNRLRQVLVNLVGNSLKFTSSGSVAIRVSRVGQRDGKTWLRFSVVDTGIGIPEERRHRLFEAFSQVDSSTTRRYGGTGLGLSICRQLVALMGGHIGVESQVGAGSTFWFEIPMEIVAEKMNSVKIQNLLEGARVLAIDGLDRERQHIGECLTNWRCPFEQVSTVTEALAAIVRADEAGTPFSVVLADCRLVEGAEHAQFQQLAARPHFHVIGIGGATDDATKAHLHSLGVRRLLADPVRPSALFNEMCFVLSVTSGAVAPQDDQASRLAVPIATLVGHLLVAEDNRINQLYIVEMLKHFGCTCDLAVNGDEAVLALGQRRYDLVLMDCQMPEMDGFEASREIRRRQAHGEYPMQIPIVALTANALAGDRQRCLDAGMDGYISKPIDGQQLRAVLGKYLGQA